jgi:small redox-active disulfide protein 2
MKVIKVLGTGCANCRATVQRVEQVANELGVPIALEKVEAIEDIMAYGILATPGVVVDGTVVHSGGIPARDAIAGWLGAREESGAQVASRTSGCGCTGRAGAGQPRVSGSKPGPQG